MAYRHPLLKPFYGDLHGRFPCFAPMRLPFPSQIVEHSHYLPHASRRLLTLPRFLPNGTKKWYDPISAPSTVNLQLSSTVNRALRACFPAVNGCAAQHSGQVLMFEGKSCSHFGSFTIASFGKCAQCSTKFVPILDFCVQSSIKNG